MLSRRLSSFTALMCVVLACTLGLFSTSARAELSCMDEDGNEVDWFIAYKFPKIKGDHLFGTGVAYSLITSNDAIDGISERSGDLADTDDTEDTESGVFLYQFKQLLLRLVGAGSGGGGGISSRSLGLKKTTSKRKKISKKTEQAKSIKSKWVVSERLVNDPESAIMRTLAPAYKKNASISSIFYNDDPVQLAEAEHTPNSRRAHAKGSLLMDESSNTGVWLTHSVPKFPTPRAQALEYPNSGCENGQTFMCVSIDLRKSGNQLVNHLFNMRPLVYDRKISASLIKRFPNLQFLDLEDNIRGKRVTVEPTLVQTISTRGGQIVNLFSKSIAYNQDLWDGYVDKELGADLYVQTWRRGGGGVLNSSCPTSDYHVNNVADLKYDSNIQWSYLKDHSKWAISDEEELSTVCIGDSNRMESQFKRGGGAACFKCSSCWSAFSGTILDTEPCPLGSRKMKKTKSIDKSFFKKMRDTLHL